MALLQDHIKNNQHHFEALTGLRGFAALWVFIFHSRIFDSHIPITFFGVTITDAFGMGWIGVHIFFVLSGFLLSIPFINWIEGNGDLPNLKKYYKRRIFRVFPAYYVQLLVLLLLAYTIGFNELLNIKEFILHLFMMFLIEPWFITPLEGTWWTLPTELSFYLALPFIAVIFKRTGFLSVLLIVIIATIVFRYFIFHSIENISTSLVIQKTERFPGHITLFTFGMLTSYIYHKKPTIPQWASSLLLIASFAWIYACIQWILQVAVIDGVYYKGHYSYFIWNTVNAIGLCGIVYCCATKNVITDLLFTNRPIFFIGIISYSFYLWHYPTIELVRLYLIPNLQENIALSIIAICAPITIIISTISYKLIEAPFIKLGRK